jgi:DNA-binding NtrC family response regulator
MEKTFTLLIADRNPHVRGYLKRELEAEGYRTLLAKRSQEIIDRVINRATLDLVILDPEFPDTDGLVLVEEIQDRLPTLPIVVHTFASEYPAYSAILSAGIFVEKEAGSIDRLKKIVCQLLMEYYPRRWGKNRILLQNEVEKIV